MEAKELRIGNWLECEGKPQSVYAVTTGTDCIYPAVAFFEGIDGPAWTDVSKCQPIPITTELLEKAGFRLSADESERMEGVYIRKLPNLGEHDMIALDLIAGDCAIGAVDYYEAGTAKMPQYLHQLQNLFYALTGTELEISL